MSHYYRSCLGHASRRTACVGFVRVCWIMRYLKQLHLSSMGSLKKVAPVSNTCYLVLPAHLCPVRPRVLDSCSLIYRAIHIREVYGTPLSQSLIPSYFLGPQTSL